jgi:hypothetical protein
MRFLSNSKMGSALAAVFVLAVAAAGQSKHCTPAGGMLMTNLGAVDAVTTLGPVSGDLKGAVSATILSTEGTGDTLILHVQHHWVTDSGDTLDFDRATATTTKVAPGLYAIVTYPVHLKGGTGKYAKASGDFNNIGEADLVSGQIVLRYTGKVCFADGN